VCSTVASRSRPIGLGQTAASKVLVAVRPRLFVYWHRPVREGFGRWRGGGARYIAMLAAVAEALTSLADRLGWPVGGLPALCDRPGMSPAELASPQVGRVSCARPGVSCISLPSIGCLLRVGRVWWEWMRISPSIKRQRETRLELATSSLEGMCSDSYSDHSGTGV
jgi:hypothetical protein